MRITQRELAKKIGFTRQSMMAIETRKRPLQWSTYLALVLVFQQSEDSKILLDSLAVYVKPLQERHKKHPISVRMENKNLWYEDIQKKKGAIAVLLILFALTYIAFLGSAVLLFWS